ncbi:MAG: hypothetical protein HFH77_10290 [Lachnospiraceae bacterium]|jgi:hypothetical protein|nr:hypothetical protein [Lachnospiraceae bacterium]
MNIQRLPVFKSGNILKQEMMESLKQYMVDYTILRYSGYSDGILRGCNLTVTDNRVTLHSGIFILGGMPFYIKDTFSILSKPTNTVKAIIMRAGEVEYERCYETKGVELLMADLEDISHTDVEICRFRLQQGAKLRYQYRDLEDMSTEFDTICLVHSQWAAFGGNSLSYYVLHQFAADMLKTNGATQEDRQFIGQIFAANGESLAPECINSYTAGRLNRPYEERKVDEMYEDLLQVLKMAKTGKKGMAARDMKERRIIVD